jgi:hypothetical protein
MDKNGQDSETLVIGQEEVLHVNTRVDPEKAALPSIIDRRVLSKTEEEC